MNKGYLLKILVIIFVLHQILAGDKSTVKKAYAQYSYTPTPYLRVRVFNPELTPITFPNNLCKVNCTAAPCTAVGVCINNVNYNDWAGAEANRGGKINSTGFVFMGVTPIQDGVVADTGQFDNTCRGEGANRLCYYWNTAIDTGYRVVRYVVATPTPTPPPKFTKLKNTSFSSANDLGNSMPAVVTAYDADDNTNPNFIIATAGSDPGSVDAQSIDVGLGVVSSKGWQTTLAQGFSKTTSMTPADYLSYVKSRKDYKTITNIDDITTNNYNNTIVVINSNAIIDDTNKSNFDNRNLVFVVNGNLNFATPADFTPSNAATAFVVTGTISISSAASEIHGIFIAPSINLGSSTDLGLKIVGNLIAQTTLTNNRKWAVISKPSVFILFGKDQYLTLLPLLSVTNYNWQQLQ